MLCFVCHAIPGSILIGVRRVSLEGCPLWSCVCVALFQHDTTCLWTLVDPPKWSNVALSVSLFLKLCVNIGVSFSKTPKKAQFWNAKRNHGMLAPSILECFPQRMQCSNDMKIAFQNAEHLLPNHAVSRSYQLDPLQFENIRP